MTAMALPSAWRTLVTAVSMTTLEPCATTLSRQTSHIIPGPYFGYWNSSMSEVMSFWFRFGSERVDDGVAERQALDPLGGPVGGHRR